MNATLLIDIASATVIVGGLFMLVRNEWVYRTMLELNRFEGDVHVPTLYLDYDEMMRKFWIWDVERLKRPNVAN